jgi:hypothetical protein
VQREIEDLTRKVSAVNEAEAQWRLTARRQRAYFMHSERISQEAAQERVRKHPAGDLFLAPAPVVLDDDISEGAQKPQWDVGTAELNPYTIDSWPFEPNVLAQRCTHESAFQSIDEGDDEDDYLENEWGEEDEEEDDEEEEEDNDLS